MLNFLLQRRGGWSVPFENSSTYPPSCRALTFSKEYFGQSKAQAACHKATCKALQLAVYLWLLAEVPWGALLTSGCSYSLLSQEPFFKPVLSKMHLTDPIPFNNWAWQHLIALQRLCALPPLCLITHCFKMMLQSNMHTGVRSCLGTQIPFCPSSPPHFSSFSIFSLSCFGICLM